MSKIDWEEWLERAFQFDKVALARLISLMERTDDRFENVKIEIEDRLAKTENNSKRDALIIGWTGTPGAGKSSLLGVLGSVILESTPLSIAIIAVDPSSHISGGSILGDRVRTRFPIGEKRIFFRSQASNLELGGLAPFTWEVLLLLRKIFDIIFVETVGIGQNEIEIKNACDTTALILQPFSGDQVQFIKSGIMEIPDFFILNKCDEEKLAKRSYHQLQSSLEFLKGVQGQVEIPQIFLTSAITHRNIPQLAQHLKKYQLSNERKPLEIKNNFFLDRYVLNHYGIRGLQYLKDKGISRNVKKFLFAKKKLKDDLESVWKNNK